MIRKLHIGGQIRVAGWEVLDINPGPAVDHVADARILSLFADDTFATVYASHVLEHFDYRDELAATLAEWCRVLEPGGTIYVSVPDLDVLARLFIDRQWLTPQERFLVMQMIFGAHSDAFDYHQVGFNDQMLGSFLRLAGFTDMQRVARFDLFEDSSRLMFKGVPVSLNMSARKPARPPADSARS